MRRHQQIPVIETRLKMNRSLESVLGLVRERQLFKETSDDINLIHGNLPAKKIKWPAVSAPVDTESAQAGLANTLAENNDPCRGGYSSLRTARWTFTLLAIL
jgi:hypothetical protein